MSEGVIAPNEYKPRKHQYEDRTFLYVAGDECYSESAAESFPRTELPNRIFNGLSDRLVATNDSSALIKELDATLSHLPNWTWIGTPLRRVKRSTKKGPDSRPSVSSRLHIKLFGFRRVTGSHKGSNLYYYVVDPVCLTGRSASHHVDVSGTELGDLIQWCNEYRDFCRENGVRCANSAGAIGGSFLRDARFIGTQPRRQIPQFINEAARKRLPGNYYELRGEVGKQYDAVYLDLESAHHNAAQRTNFPSPTSLRGRGHIERQESQGRKQREYASTSQPWARYGTNKYKRCIRQYGLFRLSVDFTGVQKGSIVPPWAKPGSTKTSVWLYSNEIELLESIGARINGIICAYSSPHTDDSLNRYGRWASEYIRGLSQTQKEWIKPLLLSTYGMLAKRAEQYQHCSNVRGRPVRYPTPDGWLDGFILETTKKHTPRTNNVIARGIIEAEVRKEVIRYARYLQSVGVEPLALYADSLIAPVQSLIPVPDGWSRKSELTGVIFYNPVSFTSREIEKMPGVDKQDSLRRARIRQVRATVGQGRRMPSTRLVGPSGEQWDTPEGRRIKRRIYGPAVL